MPTKITILKNGPLKIEGETQLCDPEGNQFGLAGKPSIFLCRCGLSANKPFCDGSHNKGNFQSEVKAK